MIRVYDCSLVLASDGNCASAGTIRAQSKLVEQLEALGIFSKVTTASLAENSDDGPTVRNVLQSLPTGDVIVVPFLTSDDTDTRTRLGVELKSNPNVDGFRVRITPALGIQSQLAELVLTRLVELFLDQQLPPSQTTVVLVGRGQERNPDSGLTTYGMAGLLRSAVPNLEVIVSFLNQRPFVKTVKSLVKTPNLLVIPFLTDCDSEAIDELSRVFGLSWEANSTFPLRSESPDGICVCDMPVGWYSGVTEICLELATNCMGNLNAA